MFFPLAPHDLSTQSAIPNRIMDPTDNSDDDITSEDLMKNKKGYHTPFFVQILKLNAPEWPWIVMGAFLSLLFGTSQPVLALFLSQIYRLFIEPNADEQKRMTNLCAAIIFVIGLVTGVCVFLSTIGFSRSGEELTIRMRKLTFSAMLRQEMGYFDRKTNSVGSLITRLSSDAAALKVYRSLHH